MKYTEKERTNIRFEAGRCLYCYDAPCIKGCPANIDIPEFIKAIRELHDTRAARIVYDDNPLGAICAEICPSDELCRGKCTLAKQGKPINIPLLQHYAVQNILPDEDPIHYTGKKVAIIGAGPGGMAAAAFLSRHGILARIYEQSKKLGGVLNSTLPTERIPDGSIEMDFKRILSMNIEIHYNKTLGKNVHLKDLVKGNDAVIIATGLRSKKIDIKGSGHSNVFFADDFLKLARPAKPKKLGGHVIVIGGGDVAMDCATQALKTARRVSLYYRRGRNEMPASHEEIQRAEEHGVSLNYLCSPVQINRNNSGDLFLEFIENTLVEDKRGRPKPVAIKNTGFKVKCDGIVFAVGQTADEQLFRDLGFALDGNLPEIGDDYQSSVDNVYLVGDIVNGGGTVVEAVKLAKEVANLILEEL
ncbi:FAD-dependent oxidoreductase [bacterium]|nr:FAD-dependent oxidoreductase [bacterium]